MTFPYPPQTFNEWLTGHILAIRGDLQTLMTESQQIRDDIAQVKADVAAEIQQVMDALAAGAANATELADLKAAVADAHTQLNQMHTDLTADDTPAPPPAP